LVNWDQDLVTDIDEPKRFGKFCPLPSVWGLHHSHIINRISWLLLLQCWVVNCTV